MLLGMSEKLNANNKKDMKSLRHLHLVKMELLEYGKLEEKLVKALLVRIICFLFCNNMS